MRSESHGSPNGPIERKGTVAIGQSVFYTDFPPKEYGHSGKTLFDIIRCSLFINSLVLLAGIEI